MNNEYESGRYGHYLKYFQDEDDYKTYRDNSETTKFRPNVSYCEEEEEVKYNWQENYVLTSNSNPTLWTILTVSGIVSKSSKGLTKNDLANITLSDIWNENDGSGQQWDGEERNEDTYPSIFYSYNKDVVTSFYQENTHPWSFDEFQYFTHPSIDEIPPKFFDSCTSLTSIVLPPQIESIGRMAFHDCWNLKNIVVPRAKSNISIYDETYDEVGDDSDNLSAFHYTGVAGILSPGQTEADAPDGAYSPLERLEDYNIIKFQPQS